MILIDQVCLNRQQGFEVEQGMKELLRNKLTNECEWNIIIMLY